MGPWLVTADEIPDPQRLALRCEINGEVLQEDTTGEMIFPVAYLVSYLSRFTTLISGTVYRDVDNSGAYNTGDQNASGITVWADLDLDGLIQFLAVN